MKPAIYLRVSTEIQSLESQRMEVLSYCAFRKWVAPVEFTDVISGSKAARPGLDALFAAINRREVDMVVVAKLDRLGRSLKHITGVIDMLRKKGVALVCTSQGIDTTNMNPMGNMQLGILSVFSEFEREMIRERTRAGLRVARENGKVLGRVSKVAPAGEAGRRAVVGAWHAETGGKSVRKLAKMLGGVSSATAAKWAREWKPVEAMEVAT